MKISLAHLPATKQVEIARITAIIREVVNPEMIILFGAYTMGTHVERKSVTGDCARRKNNDQYEFLVVTSENPEKTHIQERMIMERTDRYAPAVNLEIHDIEYINRGLETGEFFFVDMVTRGILLYDTGHVQFISPKELTKAEKKEKAQRYFDTWLPQAKTFLKGSRFYKGESHHKLAAFELHQAAESLYYAILLVFTDYKPKTHNLWKLRKKARPSSEELFSVFRAETDKNEAHLFDLLKRGYIDARYRSDYTITDEELSILIEKLDLMMPIAEGICKDKIASFDKA